MDDLKPCPFCGGTKHRIEPGGQTWRGTAGYSAPQYFHLYHNGTIPEGDGFQMCAIQIRARTEAELLSIWNTRAALPSPAIKPLVWDNFDAWTFWAESLCGTYYVTERNGTWIAELKSQGSVHIIYEIDDFDTAKAAAQADYEARIRSALVDRGGWRPIETAPKDGFFLIADFRVIDADWDCSVVVAHRDIYGGFLAYMDEEGAEIPYLDGTPTHWMPLPSPPTTEGEG